jgi:hypothetical protein
MWRNACLILPLLLLATLAAAQPTPNKDNEWELGSLRGTSEKIAGLLNNPIIELADRLETKAKAVEDRQRVLADAAESAKKRARGSADYQEKKKQYDAMKEELDALRRDNTPAAGRMETSTRMNLIKADLDKMEAQAITADPILASAKRDLQQAKSEYEESRPRLLDSIRKQLAWRKETYDALLTTFQLRAPLVEGASGIIRDATVVSIGIEGSILTYRTFMPIRGSEQASGKDNITSFRVLPMTVALFIRGQAGIREGQKFDAHQNYTVVRAVPLQRPIDGLESQVLYVLERKPAEADQLISAVEHFESPDLSRYESADLKPARKTATRPAARP